MILREYEIETTQGDYLVYSDRNKEEAEWKIRQVIPRAIIINIYRNIDVEIKNKVLATHMLSTIKKL